MRTSPGKHVRAAVPAVVIGAVGAIAVQSPARADRFSAAYTCSVPLMGQRSMTINGALDAQPSPASVGTATRFLLTIAGLSLRSPIDINRWSATATIDVDGAQNASFRLHGTGGAVRARHSIGGRLTGTWTPGTPGTDRLRGGPVTIKLNVPLFGDVTVPCTPKHDRPVMATLTVRPAPAAAPGRDV